MKPVYTCNFRNKLYKDNMFDLMNEASMIKNEEFRIEKLKIILKNVPDSILIVMRYIFQFLNQ